MTDEPKPQPTVTRGTAQILGRPYRRVLTPENDGTYRAEIAEFRGCLATGDTPEAALASLEDVAESWLDAMGEVGLPVPEPFEDVWTQEQIDRASTKADRLEKFFAGAREL